MFFSVVSSAVFRCSLHILLIFWLHMIQITGSWDRFREDTRGSGNWNQDSSGIKYNDHTYSGGLPEKGEPYQEPNTEGEDNSKLWPSDFRSTACS